MNNLKQLLIKNSIPNNTPEENIDIFDEIMKLEFKCGCNQYYEYIRKLHQYKAKTCNICGYLYCADAIKLSICIHCIKLSHQKIEYVEIKTYTYKVCIYLVSVKLTFTLYSIALQPKIKINMDLLYQLICCKSPISRMTGVSNLVINHY